LIAAERFDRFIAALPHKRRFFAAILRAALIRRDESVDVVPLVEHDVVAGRPLTDISIAISDVV
jgi:hypothetical protein